MRRQNELNKVDKIRASYAPKNAKKSSYESLVALDKKIKLPGTVISCIVGGIASLVMGTGMSAVMVAENMLIGLSLGIPGLIVCLLAYPLYLLITSSRKNKYFEEINRLCDEVEKAE